MDEYVAAPAICSQHRFGKLSYLYDAGAKFTIIRWKSTQYFGGGIFDDTKEMLKYWTIKEGDVVVDAGAHIGMYTLPALAQGASIVYAFEPQEPSCVVLGTHLALNGWQDRCMIVQRALWNKTDEILPYYWPISIPLDFSTNGWIVSRTEGAVKTITLDDFISTQEKPPSRIDWFKIDVDGSEVHLLDGAQKTIQEFKPKILISIHYDVIKAIFGHDEDVRKHLPIQPKEEIKTDAGNFIWKF